MVENDSVFPPAHVKPLPRPCRAHPYGRVPNADFDTGTAFRAQEAMSAEESGTR
jgi:hypothetical protein